MILERPTFIFFFFNDTATTEIYTLSLHDALPILFVVAALRQLVPRVGAGNVGVEVGGIVGQQPATDQRSEEHTSELQSRLHLVCRLLLEKNTNPPYTCLRSIVIQMIVYNVSPTCA